MATQQSRSVNAQILWDQLGDRLNEVFGEKLRIEVSHHELGLYSNSLGSRPIPRWCRAQHLDSVAPHSRMLRSHVTVKHGLSRREPTHNPLVPTGDAWGCPRRPLLHCRRQTRGVLSGSGASSLAALLRRESPVQLRGTCAALRRGDVARAGLMYVRVEGLRRNDTRDGACRASCREGLGMLRVHCLGVSLTLRFAEVSRVFLGYIDTCSTSCNASNIFDRARPRRNFARTPGRYFIPAIGRAGRGGPLETRKGRSLHVVPVVTLRGPPGWLERAWWRALGGVCKRGAPAATPESVEHYLTRPCPMSPPLPTSYNACFFVAFSQTAATFPTICDRATGRSLYGIRRAPQIVVGLEALVYLLMLLPVVPPRTAEISRGPLEAMLAVA